MDLPRGGAGNRVRRNIVYYSSPRAALLRTNKVRPMWSGTPTAKFKKLALLLAVATLGQMAAQKKSRKSLVTHGLFSRCEPICTMGKMQPMFRSKSANCRRWLRRTAENAS